MIESTEKLRKITGLYICKADDVLRINEIGENAYITFNGQNTWEEIKFTECSFAEPSSKSDDGFVYNQKLQILMAGDDSAFIASLKDYQANKPIIKFEYDDGTAKILGNKQNYCELMFSSSSENFETKSMLVFTREDYKPALFLLT
jgi:hypothetical protein